MKTEEVFHVVNECWQNKILIKGYLTSLKHGFEMLDEATARGLPKKNIKPYHKIKDFTKPRKKLGCDN